MKTERELFEEWAKEQDLNLTIVDFSGCVNLIDKNGNQREWCYGDFDTDIAWEAWQACAQREGYKFVPVDALEILIMYGTQYANEYDIDNLNEALELTK